MVQDSKAKNKGKVIEALNKARAIHGLAGYSSIYEPTLQFRQHGLRRHGCEGQAHSD